MKDLESKSNVTYPIQLGEVEPSLQKWGDCDFLQHEGKAVIYRNDLRFQAAYESDKLNIVGHVESDMLPAVEKLEYIIGQVRRVGDDEVQSLLPPLK